MRPESKRLDAWAAYGYQLQERELRFWGAVWSIITFEFLPRRFAKLCTYHWHAFAFPRWDFVGWLYHKREARPHSWYLRFISPYTLTENIF